MPGTARSLFALARLNHQHSAIVRRLLSINRDFTYFVVMIASVVLYDLRGGQWLILPLAWATERLCNGFWHVWWSVHFREYSPGLLSSILIWMDSYFIVRYRPVGEPIAPHTLWLGALIGLLAATLLASYIPLIKGKEIRKKGGGINSRRGI